ncbi:MAG: UDP-N-acetylmuramate:L-alanyl-gamma-D-glutamyl-meso-diaminopimelate ligase, partial [Limnohabitans sp.]|nr:UDP-N-acetylmuramate:L-alanyl-gamma-D-glutamyl-meso-diaminopimelate ligase [Limnohabitans sp.]
RGCWSKLEWFGTKRFGEGVGWHAIQVEDGLEIMQGDNAQGILQWDLLGEHNVMNALAAIAAARHVGVPPAQAIEALGVFKSVKRRMELRGEHHGVRVYDDFAHHPTAIRTTIDGLRRQLGPQARILAVFEPRSNTMKLGTMKSQLPWSLEGADQAFCHTGGLDWDAAAALAPMGTRAQTAPSIDALVRQVLHASQPGDHILCMSNGGFGGVHQRLLEGLRAKADSSDDGA